VRMCSGRATVRSEKCQISRVGEPGQRQAAAERRAARPRSADVAMLCSGDPRTGRGSSGGPRPSPGGVHRGLTPPFVRINRSSALLGEFGKECGPSFLECLDLGPVLFQLAVDWPDCAVTPAPGQSAWPATVSPAAQPWFTQQPTSWASFFGCVAATALISGATAAGGRPRALAISFGVRPRCRSSRTRSAPLMSSVRARP
jgi:hypothetical protein